VVPQAVGGGSVCPPGGQGLKCESKETQKQACQCDGKPVKGCVKGTKGGWLRIRETLQKLLKAQRSGKTDKIKANLPNVDKNLEKVKTRVNKLIDKNHGTADCKKAAADLLDEFGVRVEETFDPSGTTTTTTTLPGSLQGTASISLFDPLAVPPTEIEYDSASISRSTRSARTCRDG
jgi:hypothetical protein